MFKALGHLPNIGSKVTDLVLELLNDGSLDKRTKQLIVLKAVHQKNCCFSVIQHETYALDLGMSEAMIADVAGYRYKSSPYFSEAEKALFDYVVQVGRNAKDLSQEMLDRLQTYYTEAQIVEATLVVTIFSAMSDFGEAIGLDVEPVFRGMTPILPTGDRSPEPGQDRVQNHYSLKVYDGG